MNNSEYSDDSGSYSIKKSIIYTETNSSYSSLIALKQLAEGLPMSLIVDRNVNSSIKIDKHILRKYNTEIIIDPIKSYDVFPEIQIDNIRGRFRLIYLHAVTPLYLCTISNLDYKESNFIYSFAINYN